MSHDDNAYKHSSINQPWFLITLLALMAATQTVISALLLSFATWIILGLVMPLSQTTLSRLTRNTQTLLVIMICIGLLTLMGQLLAWYHLNLFDAVKHSLPLLALNGLAYQASSHERDAMSFKIRLWQGQVSALAIGLALLLSAALREGLSNRSINLNPDMLPQAKTLLMLAPGAFFAMALSIVVLRLLASMRKPS